MKRKTVQATRLCLMRDHANIIAAYQMGLITIMTTEHGFLYAILDDQDVTGILDELVKYNIFPCEDNS